MFLSTAFFKRWLVEFPELVTAELVTTVSLMCSLKVYELEI